ncbi:DUF499 domain-containing protein [Dehalococcoidia bacterium]|nr:DUF499 domain-containing protein [Dehalococcoidia bacterium]
MLKSWHEVAVPREDLRKGEPLDASEFAIDLEEVRRGTAFRDYVEPERFFARTCFTRLLKTTAVEVLRRLSGEIVGVSPIINLTTPFGGGKTHFLTLLYHLASHGPESHGWGGVKENLFSEAGLTSIPRAKVAVFVGDRFDPLEGKEGRLTPWGEIAWQLGGYEVYKKVEKHDKDRVAPSVDKVEEILPQDEPVLILMDEVLRFMSNARAVPAGDSNMATQFYNFLSSLSGAVSKRRGAALVASLPKSTIEMTPEDEADFARLHQLLGRRDWPVILAEGPEIAEIIRRRLFEDVDREEAKEIAKEYANWILSHRDQLAHWFPFDKAQECLENYFPFHPTTILVFERKWQDLPRFQKARGILKLLALWVSRAYQDAFKLGRSVPLLTLGEAPLEDLDFRAAVFEQLGEDRLQAAVLSDIVGDAAIAVRFDAEAPETIKKLRLHQRVAKAIFFESSGGQVKEGTTLPEIRLALGELGLDIGNIEAALHDLTSPVEGCNFLHVKGVYYHFSHVPCLTKLLADRRALVSPSSVEERIREVIRSTFNPGPKTFQRCYFPEELSDIPDLTFLILVIMRPEETWEPGIKERTKERIETFIKEYGSKPRIFKNSLFFLLPASHRELEIKARDLLAVEALEHEVDAGVLELPEEQKRILKDIKSKAQKELSEKVRQAYRWLIFLEEVGLREMDLGIFSPGVADTPVGFIEHRLKLEGILEEKPVTYKFLKRHWPPALIEWPTKKVKEDFYASPKFPRLTDWQNLKRTIAEGVRGGSFGYAIKAPEEGYIEVSIEEPSFTEDEMEFSDQTVLLPPEEAYRVKETRERAEEKGRLEEEFKFEEKAEKEEKQKEEKIEPKIEIVGIRWKGEVPYKQLMNFSTRVLSPFAKYLSLQIDFEVYPPEGVSPEKVQEVKQALRELGLDETKLEMVEKDVKRS